MESPKLYTLEHPDDPKKNTGHTERKLDTFPKTHESDRNENLKRAQQELLTDEVYEQFLKAITKIDTTRNSGGFVDVENLFITTLQDLPDTDIDSVIRQFNIGFKRFVSEHGNKYKVTDDLRRKIFENDLKKHFATREVAGNIHPNSIKNVIGFIRSRKQLLGAEPSQHYELYSESALDAQYKIDLIECLFEETVEGAQIETMNLIQIKSSEPDAEEKRKIVERHRDWVERKMMSSSDLTAEFETDLPENTTIERLTKNFEDVQLILLELLTDPEKASESVVDEFISGLHLDDLTNKQKAWLLRKHASVLQDEITACVSEGIISEEQADAIIQRIKMLESRYRAKINIPEHTMPIKNVYSIIAIGGKIIHQERIFGGEATGDRKQDRLVKYN